MKRRCPVCHKIIHASGAEKAEDTKLFPFCCERCKLVDLGAWLNADYRIASDQPSQESVRPADTPSPADDQ